MNKIFLLAKGTELLTAARVMEFRFPVRMARRATDALTNPVNRRKKSTDPEVYQVLSTLAAIGLAIPSAATCVTFASSAAEPERKESVPIQFLTALDLYIYLRGHLDRVGITLEVMAPNKAVISKEFLCIGCAPLLQFFRRGDVDHGEHSACDDVSRRSRRFAGRFCLGCFPTQTIGGPESV